MRFLYVKFIISYIFVLSQTVKSTETNLSIRCKRNHDNEKLGTSESRYPTKNSYPRYSKREYDRQDTFLPVTFQAPPYEAHDYWRYKHIESDYDNRRTFFEDYSSYEKGTTFPDFYHLMGSLFGKRDEPTTPQPYQHNRDRTTHPYPFEGYIPTQPNYIPPPKPIRASVIKLETITRSPGYPSFDFETTTKYYPHYGSILNHVLIENSKHQNVEDLSFHHSPKEKPNGPLPVLPKPVYVPATTLRPSLHTLSNVFQNQTKVLYGSRKRNKTSRKYPSSIQDQLPPFEGDVKIPYISATTIPFEVTTLLPETTKPPTRYNGMIVFQKNDEVTTNKIGNLLDIRTLNQLRTRSSRNKNRRLPKFDFDSSTLIYPVQRLSVPLFKKVNPSVEIITNLTVEGLSKPKTKNANIHNYVNFFNMSNLINYERVKLQRIPKSEWNKFLVQTSVTKPTPPTTNIHHVVNLNDELSLDAKILKDTNWDGFATTKSIPTIKDELREEEPVTSVRKNQTKAVEITTVAQKAETEIPQISFVRTKKQPEFWAIEPTRPSTTTDPETEILKTTTEQTDFLTITEPTPLVTTGAGDSTEAFVTTEEIITPGGFGERNTENILKLEENLEKTTREPLKTTTESFRSTTDFVRITTEPVEVAEMTTVTERTTLFHPRRKYVRRPKIQTFTPYPTAGELPKKTLHRNHFPKRQKPNITLAFGNKNIIKTRENYGRDEVMKFSDEDGRKRKRKPGKRRHLYKRLRTTTTEQPPSEL